MKRLVIYIVGLCLLGACSKGAPHNPDSNPEPDLIEQTAIATLKQEPGGAIYLQIDEETCLYPNNATVFHISYTGERRLICSYRTTQGSSKCTLLWMDYLLEGPMLDTHLLSVRGYGDGLELVDDWMTSVEDGYLTLHYATYWGEEAQPHAFFLVSGENPSDPYDLRLLHLRNLDQAQVWADALIYFDLKSLPSTGGSYQKLTLNWINGAGQPATKTFLFRSRQ